MSEDEVDAADAQEEIFSSVVLAYDEALASGTNPAPLETPNVPSELVPRLLSARRCLSLLEQARRLREPSSNASAPPAGKTSGADSLPPLIRGNVGRFEIERELGRGGHGIVFLARDPLLNRLVALKVPRPEVLLTDELSQRFMREAQAAGSLNHPNLVPVYEVGEDCPLLYIASAYCPGPTLAEWLRRDELIPVADAVRIAAALADGVAEAHAHGVLHRDIKPGNVVLEPRGITAPGDLAFTPKLTDFGLAKLAEYDRDATHSGVLLGTPSYMAPEQAAGQVGQIGPATDVYALGALLYELLVRRRAFQGMSDVDTLRLVVAGEPPAPRHLRSEVSRDLEAVCLKCLERNPADRYTSAAELAADLRRSLAGVPTVARPLHAGQRLVRWTQRKPAAAALACLSLFTAVTLVGLLTWHSVTLANALAATSRQRDAAESMRKKADENGRLAAEQERIANQHLYTTRMKLADDAIQQGDLKDAINLLGLYDDKSKWSTLRGFEWYYLARWLHSEKYLMPAHGEAYTVAFSRDGRQLASGGEDGTIAFWDPATGHKQAEFGAHGSCVNEIAYSPDGQTLASGGCDNAVRLWDVESHRELATLIVHDDFFNTVRWSPDGKWLAAIANGGLFAVWELASRKLVHRGDIGGQAMWVEWNPDGKSLATGTHHVAQLWEAGTWRELHRYPMKTLAAVYCRDSRGLLLSQNGSTLLYWVPGTPPLHVLLPKGIENGMILSSSSSGDRLALSATNGLLQIYDARKVIGGTFSEADKTPVVAEDSAPRLVRTLVGHTFALKDVAFSPDDSLLATASRDGTVRVWDPSRLGQSVPVLRLDLAAEALLPGQVAMNEDLTRLFVIRRDPRQLEAWDVSELSDCRLLASRAVDQTVPFRLAAGPEEHTVTFMCLDGEIDSWNYSDKRLRCLVDLQHNILRSAFSTDGTAIALLVADRTVRVLDAHTGTARMVLALKPDHDIANLSSEFRVVLSPDGSQLWLRPQDAVHADQLKSAPMSVDTRHDAFDAGAFSPDGLRVALVRSGLSVVDSRSAEEICRTRSLLVSSSIAYSADGKTLAGTDEAGFVKLWSAATAQELIALEIPLGEVLLVKFSSDGKRLAAVVQRSDNQVSELYIWTTEAP